MRAVKQAVGDTVRGNAVALSEELSEVASLQSLLVSSEVARCDELGTARDVSS